MSGFFSSSAFRYAIISETSETPITSIFFSSDAAHKTAPSLSFSFGTMHRRSPLFFAQLTIGSTPFTGLISPFSPSSPITSVFSTFSFGMTPSPTRIPTAIGRSYEAPSLRRSAGDMLTVKWIAGISTLAFFNATFTRSRASRTSFPSCPTISNAGIPFETSTSTRHNVLSMPVTAPVITLLYIKMLSSVCCVSFHQFT